MHQKAQRAEIFVTKRYPIRSRTPSEVVAAAKMSPLKGFAGFVTISFARIITSRWDWHFADFEKPFKESNSRSQIAEGI